MDENWGYPYFRKPPNRWSGKLNKMTHHDTSILQSPSCLFSQNELDWTCDGLNPGKLTCLDLLEARYNTPSTVGEGPKFPPQCAVLHFYIVLQVICSATAGQPCQPMSTYCQPMSTSVVHGSSLAKLQWLRYSVGARRILSRQVLSPGPGPVAFLSGVSRWGQSNIDPNYKLTGKFMMNHGILGQPIFKQS